MNSRERVKVALRCQKPDRIAIWGSDGTPDQIRDEVHTRIKALGPEGLLLAPAYDLDYVPAENIIALIEAVDKWGGIAS